MWFLGIYSTPGVGLTSSSLYRSEASLLRHNEFRADRLLRIVSASSRSGINPAVKEAVKEMKLRYTEKSDAIDAVSRAMMLPDGR